MEKKGISIRDARAIVGVVNKKGGIGTVNLNTPVKKEDSHTEIKRQGRRVIEELAIARD